MRAFVCPGGGLVCNVHNITFLTLRSLPSNNTKQIAWSRAGRTDKGVHAASQIVGCKLHIKVGEDEEAEEESGEAVNDGAAVAAPSEVAAVEAGTEKEEEEAKDGKAEVDVGTPAATETEEAAAGPAAAEAGAEAAPDSTDQELAPQAPQGRGWAPRGGSGSEAKHSPEEMAAAFERAREAINARLPPTIRVHALIRATRGFNAKNDCTKRRYCYMLPTFLLDDPERVGPLLDACGQVRRRKATEEEGAAADGAEVGEGGEVEAEAMEGMEGVDAWQEQEDEEAAEEVRGWGDDHDDEEGMAVAEDGDGEEGEAKEGGQGQAGDGDGAARTDLKPERPPAYDPGYPQPELAKLSEMFERDFRAHRTTPERMERLRSTLNRYLGTHKFHNFSIRMSFKSGQANR